MGYVGLPLALTFASKYKVIGFDLQKKRINELQNNFDRNKDIESYNLSNKNISYTSNEKKLLEVNVFIIAVPTPVDINNKPDFSCLINATKLVSNYLQKNSVIIYESTVYPGATEEICLPLILRKSNLTLNRDFFLGYSPERINPGDKEKTVSDIIKVTSGSNEESAEFIDNLYSSVIKAGTYKADSIKVAEAAKVIENIQRDVNIALFNELAKIFNNINIDSNDVFKAAATKWNFHKYQPGLVGGHCIGVDPYYMTFLCEKLKYKSLIISSGREINDSMANYAAKRFVDLIKVRTGMSKHKILIIGVSFKKDCNDIRNSKVFDLFKSLIKYNCKVDLTDDYVDSKDVLKKYNIALIKDPPKQYYDGIIFAVPHKIYLNKGVEYIRSFGKSNHSFFDLQSVFDKDQSDIRL